MEAPCIVKATCIVKEENWHEWKSSKLQKVRYLIPYSHGWISSPWEGKGREYQIDSDRIHPIARVTTTPKVCLIQFPSPFSIPEDKKN